MLAKTGGEDGHSGGGGASFLRRKSDSLAEIAVSEDAQVALATFTPPLNDGAPMTPDYVTSILDKLGIVNGTDWDAIHRAIEVCNLERRLQEHVIVAKGTPPVSAVPPHTRLLDRFLHSSMEAISGKESVVDWKELSPIFIIRKGETVAEIVAQRSGVPGANVFGKPVPAGTDNVEDYEIGANLATEGALVKSTVDGRLILTGRKMDIDESLQIKGNVDFHTGHIVFPGDVTIEGRIADGFKVYSGGSIFIKDTMDAFDVNARGDIHCAKGIIGRDKGLVRAGGNLKAKFIENARVAVRGDAEVPGSVVGTHLYILGALRMGDKGHIVGGETWAVHGVSCGWLGGETSPHTLVNVGTDFTVEQKLELANRQMREMGMRLARLSERLKARDDETTRKLKDETAGKVRKLSESIATLTGLVNADPAAVVEARNGVFPGVVVTICGVEARVDKPLKKTRFRLERASGRIVIETY